MRNDMVEQTTEQTSNNNNDKKKHATTEHYAVEQCVNSVEKIKRGINSSAQAHILNTLNL